MGIPDDVRQQAMDAVSGKETTAYIRAFQNSGIEASPSFSAVQVSQTPERPITDEVRQQAMDSVSNQETIAHCSCVEKTGSLSPGFTPSQKTDMIAERIAEMHKDGQSIGAIQHAMTKDNFGREHEIG
jgi:hypothetical protein